MPANSQQMTQASLERLGSLADALINNSLQSGGTDNISLILIGLD